MKWEVDAKIILRTNASVEMEKQDYATLLAEQKLNDVGYVEMEDGTMIDIRVHIKGPATDARPSVAS